jgi:YVTN family beta-propeller protein
MWRFTLCLVGLFLVPVVLISQPTTAQSQPKARPAYKNPLDLLIDPSGKWVIVFLDGRGYVGVDLVKGLADKEHLWPPGWEHGSYPFVHPEGVPTHPHAGLVTLPSLDESDKEAKRLQPLSVYFGPPSYHGKSQPDISIRAMCGAEITGPKPSYPAFSLDRYAKTNIPVTQITQGWVFTHAIRSLNHKHQVVALDSPQENYADASDMVLSPDGKRGFVAVAGADLVLVLDVAKLQRVLQKQKSPPKKETYPNFDLTASRHFIIGKLPTQRFPRRLEISANGKTLVVSNYLSDSLTVIDPVNLKVLRHISLGGPKPDAARRGEILFNSGKMTFQGQFTCASCHPNGGADGLNWNLTRNGLGAFLNTRSLLGVKDTAPYGWHGKSATLADRVSSTLRTVHRHEPQGTEVPDLVAYLESLPPPRPLPVKEADKPAVARGKALFQGKAQCIKCHHRVAYDDDKLHDVGTKVEGDTQDRFDTPALRGVARTAPYLHHGLAQTLEEVFTKYNPKNRHGAAHLLTKQELADLVIYLNSL